MKRAVFSKLTPFLLLVALALAAVVAYRTIAPASGQEAPSSQPVTLSEMPILTIGMYADGTVHKRQCKADAVVVVAAGQITAIRSEVQGFRYATADTVPSLQNKSGAFVVSLAADGSLQQGPRDCVEVSK